MVECADELVRQGKFRDVDEFKKLLLQDKDQIARSLTEQLLVFATGHKMEFADRDTPEKIYVQHKLWDRRAELVEWLEGGAYFYVCGDAKAMAKDVRAALVRAFADVKSLTPEAAEQAVVTLEREKRYLQDTY